MLVLLVLLVLLLVRMLRRVRKGWYHSHGHVHRERRHGLRRLVVELRMVVAIIRAVMIVMLGVTSWLGVAWLLLPSVLGITCMLLNLLGVRRRLVLETLRWLRVSEMRGDVGGHLTVVLSEVVVHGKRRVVGWLVLRENGLFLRGTRRLPGASQVYAGAHFLADVLCSYGGGRS